MTIFFSVARQTFYASGLEYFDLPHDLIEVDQDQHMQLLDQLNLGHHIFADLTVSEPKPTPYCVWQDDQWVDSRTEEEKRTDLLGSLRPLTRRQFKLVLALHDLDGQIESAILAIDDVKQKKFISIEYHESIQFERTNESVIQIFKLLNLTEQQVDDLWIEAMQL